MNRGHLGTLYTGLLLMSLLQLTTGCSMLRSGGVKRDIPYWAAAVTHGALNDARGIIEAVGVHSVKPQHLRVEFVPGTRRFGTQWGWYVSEPAWPGGGMYVLGVCYGRRVQVGIDPARATDPNAINRGTLVHELVHHWLMTNGHGPVHHTAYDRHVSGWAYSRRVTGWSGEGRPRTRGVVIDGVHYDVVVEAELRD